MKGTAVIVSEHLMESGEKSLFGGGRPAGVQEQIM